MSLIKPISFWQQQTVAGIPAAVQNIYLCGYNFYKWNGTRLGLAVAGGIAKISLTGTLDTTWCSNANPTNSNQVRFFTPLNGNFYCDYRIPNSSTRAFRKLGSNGLSVGSVTTSGGTIWAMSSREGNDFVLITGDTNINFNGTTAKGIGKVNEDLTLNSTFATNVGGSNGPNGFVNASALSSDRIAVLGNFTTWNGSATYERFVILNYDGTRDTGFTRSGAFNGNCFGALFIDNKWIVTGAFTTYNGVTNNRIIAFNTDGTVDTTFTTNIGTGFNGTALSMHKVTDTQFVVSGTFTTLNGATRNNIALVNTDGTIPTNIFGTGLNTGGTLIAMDADGKYYFASSPPLSTYQGATNTSNNFFAVNADGSINTSFVTGSAMQVNTTSRADAGGLYIR